MNSKKLKKKKGDNNSSYSKSDNPEVLVLPPNLLERLGINLGHIRTDTEGAINSSCPEILDAKDPPSTTGKPITNFSKETSILKTANLMKESVLLSPTFSTLKSYEVLNEEQINFLNCFEESIEDKHTSLEATKCIENSQQEMSIEQNKDSRENNSDFFKETPEIINNNNVNNLQRSNQGSIIVPYTKNEFDASKLDNNLPHTRVSENFESNKPASNINQNTTFELKNKINILSQEILDAEKIKKLKFFRSSETSTLIPVKVDTALSKNSENMKDQSMKNNLKSLYYQGPVKLDQQNISNGTNEVDVILDTNHIKTSEIRKDELLDKNNISSDDLGNISYSLSKEEIKPICLEQTKFSVSLKAHQNEFINLDTISSENLNNQKSLTDVIAQPFIQNCEDTMKYTVSLVTGSLLDDLKSVNCEINNSNIDEGENCKDKKFNSKENIVKSKLCIQGVEKPGGELEIVNKNMDVCNIKTYAKAKTTNTRLPVVTNIEHFLKNTNEIDYNVNECKAEFIQFSNFCICRDFGSFDCNESDNCYEHVHFIKKKNANCSRDILFSIYDDNYNSTEESTKEDEYLLYQEDHSHDKDGEEESINNICWHSVNFVSDVHFKEYNQYDTKKDCQSLINLNFGNDLTTEKFKINADEGNVNGKNNNKTKKSDPIKEPTEETCDSELETSVEKHVTIKENSFSKNMIICQNENNKNTPKKRKRSSMDKSDNDHSSAKKVPETFTCEPCGDKISKFEWENHISDKHCFIAWTTGQTINFEDKKLLLKLTRRLCDTGKLVCTFCDDEHNELKKFISHVNNCMNKKSSRNTHDTPTRRRNKSGDTVQPIPQSTNRLICGVCQSEVEDNLWFDHIGKEHNYLAWEQGAPPLDFTDEEKVLNYLAITRKTIGKLECSYCGVKRTHVKAYVNHLKVCANIELLSAESTLYKENKSHSGSMVIPETVQSNSSVIVNSNSERVDCAVCHETIENNKWMDHICMEHNYLAWKEGEPELNLNDTQEVNEHLYCICKEIDGLICSKCGIRRKYVKSYLTHIRKCTGPTTSQNTSFEVTLDDSTMFDDSTASKYEDVDPDTTVKCGVCQVELQQRFWLNHIQKEHAYMAWKEGQPAVDVNNKEEVLQHLYDMSKKYNGLVCNKCGIIRKYVKVYLSHIESCDSTFASNTSLQEKGTEDSYECAVCSEKVDGCDWKSHAMKKHYNIAWAVGDFPIDLKNPYAVENYLKEYKKYNKKLECLQCGDSRVSVFGFYAHIIQCGKTEEEIEEYKNLCDICNTKYLCIYKNQHLQKHREQEYVIEKKKQNELDIQLNSSMDSDFLPVSKGRQAAKRALNFIGKYQKFEFNCSSCGFGTDDDLELENHECGKVEPKDYSDSEQSDRIDLSSSEESDQSDIDSNASASEIELSRDLKRKHGGESRSFATRIKRIPFEVKNPKSFLSQSAEEFRKIHFSEETLYPQWRQCEYSAIPEEDVSKYMPVLETSCKLLIGRGGWRTLGRFETLNENGVLAAFAGGGAQAAAWAPGAGAALLAAAAHAADRPRLRRDRVYRHAAALQIWDFGDLDASDPKFVLGIAHEYGTVWSIDWCASGVRDSEDRSGESNSFRRLGLLAAACSNGSAYIFCVPYPSTITDGDKLFYNLTPVAELRFCRDDRKKFQATSISWSAQKGHSVVMVGYSDGTTALFDLEGDSPLVMETIDGVNVFYPYHEERSHNTTITGVSTLAGGRGARGLCAASSASPTGADSARRAACGVRLRAHLACSAVAHSPLWPSALLAENDGLVTQAVNELDWWGRGQRLGALRAGAACAACGALAAAAPPLLRLAWPHPAHSANSAPIKQPVAFINMTPLARKRKKRKTDELAVKLEPLTYDDAVKTYGIEFKLIKELDKNHLQQIDSKPKEHCHERFPLDDVPSLAFHPAPEHHGALAVATHAGFIFVIAV